MSRFQTPVDIGDRACQHCGQGRIDPATGFLEDRKATQEIASVYDKLRRAELQRNFWTFAIKKAPLRAVDADTMLLVPTPWSQSATYFVGSIVADGNGDYWISRQPSNTGNEPIATTAWDPYFGPLTVDAWDSDESYLAGELVYTAPGDGTNRVFLSLQSGNADNPATATAWAATATYSKDQVITYSSVAYQSLIDLNLNNTPSAAPALWAEAHSYSIGNSVGASDGVIYTSVTNANIANDPILDDGTNWTNTGVLNPWTTVFVGGSGSIKWLQIGGSEFPYGVGLTTLGIVYPLDAGPSSQSSSRNIFRLPANYLRKAQQDPKAGSFSLLGAPTNRLYDDWLIEGQYLVSSQIDLIILRFVADVQDVRLMHDMFCEGLGARIGFEVCEMFTQSSPKKRDIGQTYQKFMSEARLVNAIENDAIEAPLDDLIACRA